MDINFDMNSGLVEAIKGIGEDIKGKAKEVIGTLFGRGDLISEGKAQQDKAKAQRDVAKKEAAAEKAAPRPRFRRHARRPHNK